MTSVESSVGDAEADRDGLQLLVGCRPRPGPRLSLEHERGEQRVDRRARRVWCDVPGGDVASDAASRIAVRLTPAFGRYRRVRRLRAPPSHAARRRAGRRLAAAALRLAFPHALFEAAARSSGVMLAMRSSIRLRRSSGVMFGSNPPRPPPAAAPPPGADVRRWSPPPTRLCRWRSPPACAGRRWSRWPRAGAAAADGFAPPVRATAGGAPGAGARSTGLPPAPCPPVATASPAAAAGAPPPSAATAPRDFRRHSWLSTGTSPRSGGSGPPLRHAQHVVAGARPRWSRSRSCPASASAAGSARR